MSDNIEQEGALQAPTIREALADAVEQFREPVEQETASEAQQRARDEHGRFTKAAEAAQQQAQPQAEVTPPVERMPRPSSWKKDYEEKWNTLDPDLAKYIHQRESEFANGVSTYKAEADRARSLQQAIEPFMPDLQRHNIDPTQWIRNLGMAHQVLSQGSPQHKLQLFAQLARDYGIDPREMIGEDGSLKAPPVQQQFQPQPQPNIEALIEEKLQAIRIQDSIKAFSADTEKYPHFETVRETMAGLLQSGLAQDLHSAYDKALRMHDDLWQSQQESQRKSEEAERQRQAAEAATKARGKVASVKSATPSAHAQAATSAQGRREALAEAFASHATGRV